MDQRKEKYRVYFLAEGLSEKEQKVFCTLKALTIIQTTIVSNQHPAKLMNTSEEGEKGRQTLMEMLKTRKEGAEYYPKLRACPRVWRLSVRLIIKGAKMRDHMKPLGSPQHYYIEGFKGGP